MEVLSSTVQLSDLPPEVLGMICRLLSLEDRIALSSTCRALLHGLASSEDAWGVLEIWEAHKKLPSLMPWLASRRQGLRHLELSCDFASGGEESQPAAQLAACLKGSPLVQLKLGGSLKLLVGEKGKELQWLGSCTGLTSLALTRCGLRCLPGALERLSALAELSLAGNELAESSWGQLEQLAALTRLDVSYCGLGVLPAELAALPALAALDLHGNRQLGDAADATWAPLAQCPALTFLDLGAIQFTRLPPALAALAPNLADLKFRNANRGDRWVGGEAGLGPLFRLTGLTRLNLASSLGSQPLPEEIYLLLALQNLDLSNNRSLGEGEGQALRPLRHLTALTRLNLNDCQLKDVAEELSHLAALRDLRFKNNLPDSGLEVGWQHLRRLTALTRLDIENCTLERVPPELAELRSLADLSLRCNKLLGSKGNEGPAAAKWAALEQLTALTRLNAAYCELDTVPPAIAALSGLRVLRLGGNRSLGRGGVEALHPLAVMTALQHLDLFRCSLPLELEVDAIPFPLHCLEGWAERIEDLPEIEIRNLKLLD